MLTVDLGVAVGLLDEPIVHAEPKAGTLSDFLGGEERLDHLVRRCALQIEADLTRQHERRRVAQNRQANGSTARTSKALNLQEIHLASGIGTAWTC